MTREIWFLMKKDLLLEIRNSYAISGILLYIFSTIFIVYFSFKEIDSPTWNALFWIIVLFISVNAISKSFVSESDRLQLYYYTIAHPVSIIVSKIIYNVLLLFVLAVLAWLGFGFVMQNPIEDMGLFFLAVFLGSIGLAITLTFISAISSKTSNSSTLMAILSFPLTIPILGTLLKISKQAIAVPGRQDFVSVGAKSGLGNDILILIGIDLFLLGLALVLFPFLWRD